MGNANGTIVTNEAALGHRPPWEHPRYRFTSGQRAHLRSVQEEVVRTPPTRERLDMLHDAWGEPRLTDAEVEARLEDWRRDAERIKAEWEEDDAVPPDCPDRGPGMSGAAWSKAVAKWLVQGKTIAEQEAVLARHPWIRWHVALLLPLERHAALKREFTEHGGKLATFIAEQLGAYGIPVPADPRGAALQPLRRFFYATLHFRLDGFEEWDDDNNGRAFRVARWPDGLTPRQVDDALVHACAIAAPDCATTPEASERLRAVSVASRLAVARPAPPAEVLPRLAWAGRLSHLVGRDKGGKTTLAAHAVVDAAIAGRTVLWLSTDEDEETVTGRFLHLVEQGRGLTDPAERDVVLGRLHVTSRRPESWTEVEALWSEGWRPDAVVVDTMGSFLMAVDGSVPESHESQRWQALVLRFKAWVLTQLRREDGAAAVLLLVHANKTDGTYSGSHGIGAAPDAIVTLFGGPGYRGPSLPGPDCRRLERLGRFGIGNVMVTLRYGGDAHPGFEEVVVTTNPASVRDELARAPAQKFLLQILDAAGAEGIQEAEWRRRGEAEYSIGRTGTFNSARNGLVNKGRAVKRGGRWYSTAIV